MFSKNDVPIVVQLTGGLGNQLFGVAAGLGIARRWGLPLVLDISRFSGSQEIRSSGIDCYKLPFETVRQVNRNGTRVAFNLGDRHVVAEIVEEQGHRFDSSLAAQCSKGGYVTGYFQSHKYFESVAQEVRMMFRHLPKLDDVDLSLEAQILASESVGVHVRRGDYLKSPHYEFHGVCEIGYFRRAIEIMRERLRKPMFFVFSDDLDWCRRNLEGDDVVFAGGASPNADLDLLANCKRHILSNSSFSWWGAWLAESRSVLAPYPWYTRIPLVPDMIPATWEILHRTTGEDWTTWESKISATKVSVIVPTHRRTGPLVQAVKSALGQTHQNLDVTIVLSSATTEVKHEAAQLQRANSRVNVVSAISAGPSGARNTGVSASKGEWVAFLDDDDLWFPDKIRTQLSAAIAFGVHAVSCEHAFSGPGLEKFRYPPNNLTLREALVLENFFSGGSAAIVSRDAFGRAGGFDETLRGCEDQDLWRRLSLNGRLMIVAEPLLEIRRLDESNSSDRLMMLQSQVQHLVKIIRESPPDFGHLVALAIRSAQGHLNQVAMERGLKVQSPDEALNERFLLSRTFRISRRLWRIFRRIAQRFKRRLEPSLVSVSKDVT
jgi:glycosyltransferase involved in cell wall biosynthesis